MMLEQCALAIQMQRSLAKWYTGMQSVRRALYNT